MLEANQLQVWHLQWPGWFVYTRMCFWIIWKFESVAEVIRMVLDSKQSVKKRPFSEIAVCLWGGGQVDIWGAGPTSIE